MAVPRLNRPRTAPQVAGNARPLTFNRQDFLGGRLPAYWGPAQSPASTVKDYSPPGRWPHPGRLLRVPRVARFIWETSDFLDQQCVIWMGYTGKYSYGPHTEIHALDITAPPGVFPTHGYTEAAWPLAGDPGFFADGISQTHTLTGRLDVIDGSYVANGFNLVWYGHSIPYVIDLQEYEKVGSPTWTAISELWHILSDGFEPAMDTVFGVIPPIHDHVEGPTTVGVTNPLLTGLLLDPITGDVAGGKYILPDPPPVTIPVGWTVPLPKDRSDHETHWKAVAAAIDGNHRGRTDPYVDSYERGPQENDFWAAATPSRPTYFGTDSLTMILIAKIHEMDGAADAAARIRDQLPNLPGYRVVLLLDVGWLTDSLEYTADEIAAFLSQLRAFASGLSDCGWSTVDVNYKDEASNVALIESLIATHLPPDPTVPDALR